MAVNMASSSRGCQGRDFKDERTKRSKYHRNVSYYVSRDCTISSYECITWFYNMNCNANVSIISV